ncbi:MAG: transcriptional regulator NrdR [Candidatus Gracilibacteria bacterium]
MKCPKCTNSDTKVLDSRVVDSDRAIRRRRECDKCGFRFTTYEKAEMSSFVVVKKDGTREPYKREKVEEGIWRACTKRPVSVAQVSDLVARLEEKWGLEDEVPSRQIGEDIMEGLKAIDEVAYIRFASVYRRFKDVDEFKKEMEELWK